MTDDNRVPTTLLAVGIVCIIILSIIIVWLIICCEKRRRATFRFKPGQGSTVYRNPSHLEKDLIMVNTHPFSENSINSDNEEAEVNFLDIPIHAQITAILGSFPDITDYKPFDFSDSDSGDECDSASLINKDSKTPSIVKMSNNNINSSIADVNLETNATECQKHSSSDTNINNDNSTTNSHTIVQQPQTEDENIYSIDTDSLCTTSFSTKISDEEDWERKNLNGKRSMIILETTI